VRKLLAADIVSESHNDIKKKKKEDGVKEWLEAVAQCLTLSRLNVLIGILESCVKWEKSAENAVCTVTVQSVSFNESVTGTASGL